jgi:hypothetical protein
LFGFFFNIKKTMDWQSCDFLPPKKNQLQYIMDIKQVRAVFALGTAAMVLTRP